MDPVTIASLTTAVVLLATEAGKSGASEAGKAAWGAIQKLLNVSNADANSDLATEVAKALTAKPELAAEVRAQLDAVKNGQISQSIGMQGTVQGNRDVEVAGRDIIKNFR
jgi:hypothetical protein